MDLGAWKKNTLVIPIWDICYCSRFVKLLSLIKKVFGNIIFSLSKSVTAAVFWCWYQLSVVSDCSNNDINKVNNPTFALFWANIVVHENRQLYIYIYIKFTWCMKIHQLFSSIKFRIIKFKVSTFIGNYRAIKRCEIVSSNFIL